MLEEYWEQCLSNTSCVKSTNGRGKFSCGSKKPTNQNARVCQNAGSVRQTHKDVIRRKFSCGSKKPTNQDVRESHELAV